MTEEQASRHTLEPFTFTTFKEEIKEIFTIGWILAVSLLCEYLMFTTSVFFCSRLGNKEMAAMVLSQVIIAITCLLPGAGMMTVCNTYFAAGRGANHGRKQGIFLQKAFFLSIIASLFCCSILINIEQLLLIFHQDPDVARITGVFVRTYLPAIQALFASLALCRMLQARNKVLVTMLILLFSVFTNVFLNFLFVIVLGGGFRGSAFATVVSQYVCLIILCVYVYKYEDLELFSIESLGEWGEFFSIAFHGCLTTTLSHVVLGVFYLLAGQFGVFYINVFGAFELLLAYLYIIWIGFCYATSILVGQYLGGNKPKNAKILMEISFIFAWILALLIILLLIIFRNYLGYIYTSDKDVIHEFSTLVPFLILFQLTASTGAISKSVLLACGKQYIGAITSVFGNIVGCPLGIYLAFELDYKVIGLWLGLTITDCLQATMLIILVLNLNFWKEAKLTLDRCTILQTEEVVPLEDTTIASGTEQQNNSTTTEETALIQSYGTFKLDQKTIILRVFNFIFPISVVAISIGIYVNS